MSALSNLLSINDSCYEKQLDHWLRLYLTPQVGVKTFWKEIHAFTDLKRSPSLQEVHAFRERHLSCVILPAFDRRYPPLLRHCSDCPPILFCRGNLDIFMPPMVSVVGGRRASLGAMKWVHDVSCSLAKRGYIIVSGLARGIDGASHNGALVQGTTVAVLAGGLDKIYPKEHTSLYKKIEERGCLVSENPLGVDPSAGLFPKRNRIIAGLSYATLVVEAMKKSGTMITAYAALDYNRLVFSVPGSPWDERCWGSNNLIQQGAFLCDSVESLIEILERDISFLERECVDTGYGGIGAFQKIFKDKFDQGEIPNENTMGNYGNKKSNKEDYGSFSREKLRKIELKNRDDSSENTEKKAREDDNPLGKDIFPLRNQGFEKIDTLDSYKKKSEEDEFFPIISENGVNSLQTRLLCLLSPTPVSIQEICDTLRVDMNNILIELSELELLEKVRIHPGSLVSLF